MEIAATSTEYLHIPITSTLDGAPYSIGTPPKIALLGNTVTGNPTVSDWITAEWVDGYARLLIGPAGGATTLAVGTYWAWITWVAGDETPVYKAGQVRAY